MKAKPVDKFVIEIIYFIPGIYHEEFNEHILIVSLEENGLSNKLEITKKKDIIKSQDQKILQYLIDQK